MRGIVSIIIRFVVSALVLMLLSFVLPGFRVIGFVNAIIAAVAIALLGHLATYLLGQKASPQNRGIVSFIVAAVVIYLAQFVVPTMRVTILGAILASVIIGIVDAVVPTELR